MELLKVPTSLAVLRSEWITVWSIFSTETASPSPWGMLFLSLLRSTTAVLCLLYILGRHSFTSWSTKPNNSQDTRALPLKLSWSSGWIRIGFCAKYCRGVGRVYGSTRLGQNSDQLQNGLMNALNFKSGTGLNHPRRCLHFEKRRAFIPRRDELGAYPFPLRVFACLPLPPSSHLFVPSSHFPREINAGTCSGHSIHVAPMPHLG